MKVQWIIDTILLERHDSGFGFPTIEEAVYQSEHTSYATKYVPFSENPDEVLLNMIYKSEPVIFYGSIEWINQLDRCGYLKKYLPGAYLRKEQLKYSNYAWRYPDMMLNDDYIMLPFGEIKVRQSTGFFIRPDAVTKSFPGHVIDGHENKITDLETYDKIYPEELCVIACPKKIIGEYRHVICNHELIAQCQYRRDGKLDIRIDVDPACQTLAKWISRGEYQVDNVYVVDTALTKTGAKIIEFNAFSCSGLYAMDTRAIVKRVSEAAISEFKGEDV